MANEIVTAVTARVRSRAPGPSGPFGRPGTAFGFPLCNVRGHWCAQHERVRLRTVSKLKSVIVRCRTEGEVAGHAMKTKTILAVKIMYPTQLINKLEI